MKYLIVGMIFWLGSCHSTNFRNMKVSAYLKPPSDTVYNIAPLDSLLPEEKNAIGIWQEPIGLILIGKKNNQLYYGDYWHDYRLYTDDDSIKLFRENFLEDRGDGKLWVVMDSAAQNRAERFSGLVYFVINGDSTLSLYAYKDRLMYTCKKIGFLKQTYLEKLAQEYEDHRHHVIAFKYNGAVEKIYWKDKKLYCKGINFYETLWDIPLKAAPHEKGISLKPSEKNHPDNIYWIFDEFILDTSLTKIYIYQHGEWIEPTIVEDPEYTYIGKGEKKYK